MKRYFLLLAVFWPSCGSCLIFGPFLQISPTGANGVPPLLTVSTGGNAFAAWLNNITTLQVAYFTAGTNTWVSATIAANAAAPQVGIDGGGAAFVVWVSTNLGPSTQIFVSRFTAATLPTVPTVPGLTTQLSTPGTYNSAPQIAVSEGGSAVVVWVQTAPFQILAKSFNPVLGTWSTVPLVLPFLPASMALDGAGNGFAIINSFSGPVQGVIQVSRIVAP